MRIGKYPLTNQEKTLQNHGLVKIITKDPNLQLEKVSSLYSLSSLLPPPSFLCFPFSVLSLLTVVLQGLHPRLPTLALMWRLPSEHSPKFSGEHKTVHYPNDFSVYNLSEFKDGNGSPKLQNWKFVFLHLVQERFQVDDVEARIALPLSTPQLTWFHEALSEINHRPEDAYFYKKRKLKMEGPNYPHSYVIVDGFCDALYGLIL